MQDHTKFKVGDRVIVNEEGFSPGSAGTIENVDSYEGYEDFEIEDMKEEGEYVPFCVRLDGKPHFEYYSPYELDALDETHTFIPEVWS